MNKFYLLYVFLMFLNNLLSPALLKFAPNLSFMLYVVGTLFFIFSINAISKILPISRTLVWSYVLGVVVWCLSLQRNLCCLYCSRKFNVSLNKLVSAVFVILLTKRVFTFMWDALHYQNPIFFRRSKLGRTVKRSRFLAALSWLGISTQLFTPKKSVRRRYRHHRRAVFARTCDIANSPNLKIQWRPEYWLRLRTLAKYSRKKRKNLHYYRARVSHRRFTAIYRQPSILQRLRWFCTVVIAPYLHFYFSRLARWPLLILVFTLVLPVILHIFSWFVQDYELTYRNLFKDYRFAAYDLFEKKERAYFGSTIIGFFAILLRMYLNGLESFYFERWPIDLVVQQKYHTTVRISVTLWVLLFSAISLSAFLHGYSVGHWAEMRFFRTFDKRPSRKQTFKLYYVLFFRRLKRYARLHRKVPVHPDKGRTDDSSWVMLTLIFVARSLPEQYTAFTGWLTEWVLAFRWAHVAFALFLLACFILHFVTRVILIFTRKFLYRAPISWFWFLWNLFFSAVFLYSAWSLWFIWMPKYCPYGGPFANVYDLIVNSFPWWLQTLTALSFLIGVGIAFFQLRERKRLRRFIGYIRGLHAGRRIKYNRTNRNVLGQFLGSVISSAEITHKDVYQPVVKSVRRGNPRNIKSKQ